jgi:hypothetical protein
MTAASDSAPIVIVSSTGIEVNWLLDDESAVASVTAATARGTAVVEFDGALATGFVAAACGLTGEFASGCPGQRVAMTEVCAFAIPVFAGAVSARTLLTAVTEDPCTEEFSAVVRHARQRWIVGSPVPCSTKPVLRQVSNSARRVAKPCRPPFADTSNDVPTDARCGNASGCRQAFDPLARKGSRRRRCAIPWRAGRPRAGWRRLPTRISRFGWTCAAPVMIRDTSCLQVSAKTWVAMSRNSGSRRA